MKIALASLIASGAAYGIDKGILLGLHYEHPGKAVSLLILAVAGGLSLVVYGGLCIVLRVSEVRGVREMFKRGA